jgi:hypothetical protein
MTGIQAWPTGYFWFWAVGLSLAGLTALFFAFRNLARARIIEDTPTARIRSAHQGYVELVGEAAAMKGEPILSPLTLTPCCWYRYRVERRHDKGWRTVKSGASEGLFLIRDETGQCIVNPDGADITPTEKSVWYGASATPSGGPAAAQKHSGLGRMTPLIGLSSNISIGFGDRYRYTEEAIYPGEQLYAIGLFNTFGEADRLAMREELIRERLSQWKADHATLLARFDRNGDGQIDLAEWEVARRSAKREVAREQLREADRSLHTLSDTDSRRRPFLISTHGEFRLTRRFRRFAFGALAGFFILGSGAVWVFVARFGSLLS